MPTVVQFRRGTTAQNDAFTGAVGEVSVDTDKDTLRVHDGSTAGGFEVVNTASTQTISNKTIGSDLLPSADSAYDLGSPSFKWKDLHLSGSTIFLGGLVLKDVGGSLSVQDSAGSSLAGSFSTLTTTGNVTIGGDLTIEGTTTTVNTTNLVVEDKNIVIASGAVDSAAADGAGITIDNLGIYFQYDATGDTWNVNKPFGAGFNALSEYNTGDISEGSNLYYTTARADSDFDVRLGTKSTANLTEGSNLYYTTARADSDFDVRLGTKSTTALAEGDNLYYTRARFDTALGDATSQSTIRGYFSAAGDLTYNSTTGEFSFDVENVYTQANFDSDFNTSLDAAALGGIGLTYNSSTNTLSVDSAELYANFSLDGFNDYVANEHINHTAVTMTAGSGLTGGGDISSTRTFNVGQGTGITVSADAIATNDSQIVHDNLSGFVADEHVAHSGVTLTAGSGLNGGGDISASRTFNIDSSELYANFDHDGFNDYVANEHINHTSVTMTAGSGLTGGGDISSTRTFDIGQGTGITVSADAIATNDAEIVHDNLSGFVADEHIAHSGVTLTAGTGLNGGGDISSSRTFNIDSAELYAKFSLGGFNDYVADEQVAHSGVTLTAGSGLTGGGTIAASRTFNIGQGTGITVSADAIATNDAQIVHDNLSGFVADEHIAHSGVTLTAGAGLTGGGTIAASRTFNIGAGTGVTVNADDIAIGQDVATTADVTFNNITNNGWLDFKHDSATPPAHSEGRVYYSEEYKALTYRNDIPDVSLQVGLEEWIRVYNDTGSTITNGTPVYATGANGETLTVAPADATTEIKARVIGLATHDISNASEGVVTVRGLVADLNTSGISAGSSVHLAADGSLQSTAPTYPYFPTDLGQCVVSDSSAGYVYVTISQHTDEQYRVTGNQHIGGNLTIEGDLTVTGTQSVVSQANLAVDTSFIYTNSGDTVDSDVFTGSGLNDATFTGHYTGTETSKTFYVRIDGTGTPDTFEWSLDNFSTTEATDIAITGADQTLEDGIKINFNATTGHTIGDVWSGTASPVNVDAGFASNRNTGATGVGYTHMGMFFDVTDEKWKLFKSYDPEPEGTINTGDASYEKATLDANLTGNVTGNLTGAVTGNATTATALATARTIGGVSFDGTSDINLPGVNTTGNQNTSGNAATATALATGRTIALDGDVTATGVSFDGTGNISLTTAMAANSVDLTTHTTGNYVASITNGNYITGGDGGTEGAGLTLAVDATSANTASKVVARDGSGNFSAGTITAALSGNATTATTLATGRTIALDGDVTATGVSFNGSSNISLSASIASNVVGAAELNVTGNGTTAQFLRADGDGSFTWATPTDTNTTYSAGTALDLDGTTFNLNLSDLATSSTNGDGDYFVVVDTLNAQRKLTKANIALSGFDNDAGWTSNVGDITGVTAGTGLTGGGTSGSVTLNVSGVTSSMFSSPNSLVIYNSAGTALKTIRGPGS